MSKSKPLVVLIEDEKMLADMYQTKFSKEGFEVKQTPDGLSGLKLVKEFKPDVVLLDIILPKLDGFAVLKDLKSDPQNKKIPVILLTNLGQEEDIGKGKKLGADDYFVKANHTPAEVVDKVKKVIKKK